MSVGAPSAWPPSAPDSAAPQRLRDIPEISQKLLRGSSPKGVGNRQKPTRESEVGRAPLASFQVTFYWNLPVVLILPSPLTWLLYHPTRVLGGFRSISRASSSTEARKRKHACRRKPCYAFFPKELFSSSTEARKRKHACRRKQCYAFFPKELFPLVRLGEDEVRGDPLNY